MEKSLDQRDMVAVGRDEFQDAIRKVRWPKRSILMALLRGGTFSAAAKEGRISRATLWRWCRDSVNFAILVNEARRIGAERRRYFVWLRHPFRGRRPPCADTGTAIVRPKPKWTYGFAPR